MAEPVKNDEYYLEIFKNINEKCDVIPFLVHQVDQAMKKFNGSKLPNSSNQNVAMEEEEEEEINSNDEESLVENDENENDTSISDKESQKSTEETDREENNDEKDEDEDTDSDSDVVEENNEVIVSEKQVKEEKKQILKSFKQISAKIDGQTINLSRQQLKTVVLVLSGLESKKVKLTKNFVRSAVKYVLNRAGVLPNNKKFEFDDENAEKVLEIYKE